MRLMSAPGVERVTSVPRGMQYLAKSGLISPQDNLDRGINLMFDNTSKMSQHARLYNTKPHDHSELTALPVEQATISEGRTHQMTSELMFKSDESNGHIPFSAQADGANELH